ncbi:MAG: 50S ribosomal protein L9 [Phycisphaerae bacterium]|jgi:large subunit ribosomal protein L9
MRLLLLKDVPKLGHLGDVVEVKPGYARNHLLPMRLATEPTEENIRAIEEERKRAAAERAKRLKVFTDLIDKLADVSVTIEAAANPEGTLYGSVGPKEIADALHAQGFAVLPDHVLLDPPLRTLDNRVVTLQFADDLTAEVKVWVVRQGAGEHGESAEHEQPEDDGVDDDYDDDADD